MNCDYFRELVEQEHTDQLLSMLEHQAICWSCECFVRRQVGLPMMGQQRENPESFYDRKCLDCGQGHLPMYMVKPELWEEFVGDKRAVLCFQCFQTRMKRPLTFDDLLEVGLTSEMMLGIQIARQTYGNDASLSVIPLHKPNRGY